MAEYKTDAQVNYGWGLSFNMTGKAPAISKRIFATLADAQAYVDDATDSAIAGLQLSVINDIDTNKNGIYFVSSIGDGSNAGVLTKVGSDTASELTNITNRVSTVEGTVATLSSTVAGKADTFTVGNALQYEGNNIDVKIDPVEGNALTASAQGLKVVIPEVEVPAYEIVKLTTAEGDAAASYQLHKDGVKVGATINIPKDMVVSSGSVKTVTTAGSPYEGAVVGEVYIELILNNDQALYIPANKLVDEYTAGDYITVNDRVIGVNYSGLKTQISNDLNISNISTDVTSLKTTVGDSTSGLVKKASDNANSITELQNALNTSGTGIGKDVADLKTVVGDSSTGLVASVASLQTTVDGDNVRVIDSTASYGVTLAKGSTDKSIKVVVTPKTLADSIKPELNLTEYDASNVNITSNIGGDLYVAGTSVQDVLSNLNDRISSAVSGGLTSIAAGNGISVSSVSGNSQTVSIKIATGSALSATADGLDLYWSELE